LFAVDLLRVNPALKEKTITLLKDGDFSIRDIEIEEAPFPVGLLATLPVNEETKQNLLNNGVTTIHLLMAWQNVFAEDHLIQFPYSLQQISKR
jgi:hypothetical protein